MSIKIENIQVFGWEAAIRGARNPMNSCEKSDSWFDNPLDEMYTICGKTMPIYNVIVKTGETGLKGCGGDYLIIGPNDRKLLMNLAKGGTEEAKWRRMVHVQMDVTAPLYWWKEFETYKVGTTSNSNSTMHKIHAKEFSLEDFSIEHLIRHKESVANDSCGFDEVPHVIRGFDDNYHDIHFSPKGSFDLIIEMLNKCREQFLETKDKKYWWQLIQLLPSSYNQTRTIDLNYEVLAAQYRQRKDHKLDEWREYCTWIRRLPYSEFITLEEREE